jgi:hypothetical protein
MLPKKLLSCQHSTIVGGIAIAAQKKKFIDI